MIPELQGFVPMFRANHGLLHKSLEGLTEMQAMEHAGSSNPILWIAAHVVTVRCMIAQALGAKVEVPWGGQFPRGGRVEDVKSWPTLAEVTAAAQAFLNPVLADGLDASWNPGAWTWERR